MTLKLMKKGRSLTALEAGLSECQNIELNNFCVQNSLDLTFEWINGQFWLHSDDPKEKPIGIEIDRELNRHEQYFKSSSLKSELLAKAIGIKGGERPRVLDLTAGMLGDTLLFLSFGCEVWASERHPVIKFLIETAMRNAQHPKLLRFHFLPGDAEGVLLNPPETEVIYYDPMYEDASSKTSPRKEMRIFRNLVGKDQDAEIIFKAALNLKPKRLIVKRPRSSGILVMEPSVEYVGKSTRYDVYFSL